MSVFRLIRMLRRRRSKNINQPFSLQNAYYIVNFLTKETPRTMRILCFLMLFGMLFSCQKKECSQASDCSSFGPPAEGTITCQQYVEGYYYDANQNKCLYYAGSSCGAPPFEKERDCIPCECAE
jgi:hypothetical protein